MWGPGVDEATRNRYRVSSGIVEALPEHLREQRSLSAPEALEER
jgi:hypothetical protein